MAGIIELEQLLKSMSPELQKGEYIFCSLKGQYADYVHLKPISFFLETEGLSLIISKEVADQQKIAYASTFKQITLKVHSSLDAVGLTAAVANKLTSFDISANVVAAYYHDHIFVQTEKAEQALSALQELC